MAYIPFDDTQMSVIREIYRKEYTINCRENLQLSVCEISGKLRKQKQL